MKKIFSMFIAGVAALSLVSCADDLKEQNIDPANVTETLPAGLLAAAINVFQPTDYLLWFYNVNYFTQWDQMAGGSYSDDCTNMTEWGGQGSQYINTLKYQRRIDQYIATTGETKYNGYAAATNILSIYLGIFDSDMYGAIPWTEACHYEDQNILTPKYDTVEELYDEWITELNNDISLLLDTEDLDAVSREDAAYGATWTKWAKLANSLKLKIAVRLLANNQTKAMQIANEAATNRAGLITETDDDFSFNKAYSRSSGNDDYVYGTGNGLSNQTLSDKVQEYMLACKDPRIRFIFTKNSYNSKVVQSFIDAGKWDKLPRQVRANVIRDENGNFKEWGGMGEPWVRYTSIPITYNPKAEHDAGRLDDETYEEYFNAGTRYQIDMVNAAGETKSKSYGVASSTSEEMRRGRCDFTLPTAMSYNDDGSINMNVIQDTQDQPLYQMYLGAGEVNLYLAELALLSGGTFNGKTAEVLYLKGIECSVEEFDALARNNKIPYYGTTYSYDPNEKVIDLQANEIQTMLATPSIAFTGNTADNLEKVYLQQMMNFWEMPCDQYVTARRSGYPKVGSTLLPRVEFPGIALSAFPRRFVISEPLITDKMYDIEVAAYKNQGFEHLGTTSAGSQYNNGNAPLNTERLWQDGSAPQWGTPKQ